MYLTAQIAIALLVCAAIVLHGRHLHRSVDPERRHHGPTWFDRRVPVPVRARRGQ